MGRKLTEAEKESFFARNSITFRFASEMARQLTAAEDAMPDEPSSAMHHANLMILELEDSLSVARDRIEDLERMLDEDVRKNDHFVDANKLVPPPAPTREEREKKIWRWVYKRDLAEAIIDDTDAAIERAIEALRRELKNG